MAIYKTRDLFPDDTSFTTPISLDLLGSPPIAAADQRGLRVLEEAPASLSFKTAELFPDDAYTTPESMGWEEAPRAVPMALKAVDIAAGGPLVRGLLNAPASMPEAETQTEVQPASITQGILEPVSEKAFTGYEVAPPEALTQTGVGELSPETARGILPAAAELALYPPAAKVMGEAAKVGGQLIAKGAKKTAELFPELETATDALLRSEAGMVKAYHGKEPGPLDILKSERGAVTVPPSEPKYAGSVNLHRLDLPENQKAYVTKVYDENKRLIDEARRGTIPLAETEARAKEMLAADLGIPKVKWQKGKALNAEQITEVRLALANANIRVSKIAGEIAAGQDSTENLVRFAEAVKENLSAQVQASAVASEAGRALSAMRISAGGVDLTQAYTQRMIEALGGREVTVEIAKRMAKSIEDGPLAVAKFIRDAATPKLRDKIFEVWINGLLSGPKTHIVNTAANALTFLLKFPERAIGTAGEYIRAGVTRETPSRFFGEVPAELFGAWQGVKQGVKKAVFAFKNEIETGGITKFEQTGKLKGPAIKGITGQIVRIPSRSLMAADEFFKAVNSQAELHGLAYRAAMREGLRGEAKATRIADLLENPTAQMLAKSEGEAVYRTFQKPYGQYGQTLSRVRDIPGIRYIVPFMRTPLNIAKFGLERTPLNFLRIGYKALKGQELEWTDELARASMGSMIGAMVAMYAAEGKITGGGPPDKGTREAQERLGWKPYSIKVGDTFYSYQRLEPLGSVFGMAADYAEIAQRAKAGDVDMKHLASQIAASIAQNLTSKTFLYGISEAINAMDDPQRYGEQYLKNLTGTLVPTGAYQVGQALDPTVRRSDDVVTNLMRRTPGLSEKVLPKLDLWGRPVEREQTGLAAFSPMATSTLKRDPVDMEIIRLGANVTIPGMNMRGVRLTPEQHYDYIRLAGQRAKDRLDDFVAGPGWQHKSDEKKAADIRRIIEEQREWARRQLIKEYPELRDKIREGQDLPPPEIPMMWAR